IYSCHPEERRISFLLSLTNGSGCFLRQHDKRKKSISLIFMEYLITSSLFLSFLSLIIYRPSVTHYHGRACSLPLPGAGLIRFFYHLRSLCIFILLNHFRNLFFFIFNNILFY